MPMRFLLQRYSHLEETYTAKISITDIIWTPHHTMEIPWQVGVLEPAKKTKKRKIWTPMSIWLDCKRQSKNSILELTCLEYDQDPNTIIIEYSFLFPTVIYTPWYHPRFMSYAVLKSAVLLKFWAEQIWAIWEICTFDPNTNRISGNFQYYHCR
jgi:hypothetical protein